MNCYFLALTIPKQIQNQILPLCFGLPNIQWIEPGQFHVLVRYLGKLTDPVRYKVEDQLETLTFAPFEISLAGLEYSLSKGGHGSLSLKVKPQETILKLKHAIDQSLKGVPVETNGKHFIPHTPLGFYEQMDAHWLGDYLVSQGMFETTLFAVSSLTLFSTQTTPKRVIYKPIRNYEFTTEARGEQA